MILAIGEERSGTTLLTIRRSERHGFSTRRVRKSSGRSSGSWTSTTGTIYGRASSRLSREIRPRTAEERGLAKTKAEGIPETPPRAKKLRSEGEKKVKVVEAVSTTEVGVSLGERSVFLA
jgi:hypothetical protein